MDVINIKFILNKPYLHVFIDTYFNFIWAVLMPSERAKAIYTVLVQYVPKMGIPNIIKTNIGAVYTNKSFQLFFCNEYQNSIL